MRVCVLTEREVARFKNHDICPNCIEHRHMDPAEALLGIQDGDLDFVYEAGREMAVTPAKLHSLRVMPSGGMPIVQRVESNGLKYVQEAR